MFAAFREEAKRIATAMEDARNRDVFSDLLRRGPRAMLPTETGFDVLMAASDRRREGGYASIRALLVDTTTKRFVLAMQTFVARCGWRTAEDQTSKFAIATHKNVALQVLAQGPPVEQVRRHGQRFVVPRRNAGAVLRGRLGGGFRRMPAPSAIAIELDDPALADAYEPQESLVSCKLVRNITRLAMTARSAVSMTQPG